MKYKTCVSIAETTPKNLEKSVRLALKKSEYVEIRFDFLRPEQIPDALKLTKKFLKKSVCTLRPKSEGGKFPGSEMERKSILKLIAEYKPFLLDVEFNSLKKDKGLLNYIKKTKTDILVSWHDFRKTPDVTILKTNISQMRKLGKVVKIVTTAKSTQDASRILSLYAIKSKTPLIAFAMGEYGRISRILCLYLGSPYTYVSLGKPVAPGQFSLDEVKSILDLKKN